MSVIFANASSFKSYSLLDSAFAVVFGHFFEPADLFSLFSKAICRNLEILTRVHDHTFLIRILNFSGRLDALEFADNRLGDILDPLFRDKIHRFPLSPRLHFQSRGIFSARPQPFL
jgi:hypothetical protein